MAHFNTVSDEELTAIINDKDSSNTKKPMQNSWSIFSAYLSEKNRLIDINTVKKSELDNILEKFYVEATKKNKTLYSKSSLCAIRFGIQRHISSLRSDVDIIDGDEFFASNISFKSQCIKLKKLGLAKVEHKPPICLEDMQKLYSSPVLSCQPAQVIATKSICGSHDAFMWPGTREFTRSNNRQFLS